MDGIATIPHPFVSPWTVLYAITEVQLERLAAGQIETFVLTCAGERFGQTYVQACRGESEDLIIEIHAPKNRAVFLSPRASIILPALGFHPPASHTPNYWKVVPLTANSRWVSKTIIDAFVQSWAIEPSLLFSFGDGDDDRWIATSKAISIESVGNNWFRVPYSP